MSKMQALMGTKVDSGRRKSDLEKEADIGDLSTNIKRLYDNQESYVARINILNGAFVETLLHDSKSTKPTILKESPAHTIFFTALNDIRILETNFLADLKVPAAHHHRHHRHHHHPHHQPRPNSRMLAAAWRALVMVNPRQPPATARVARGKQKKAR